MCFNNKIEFPHMLNVPAISSEGKSVIKKLAYFKKCLEDVLLYYQMPLPAIIGQSVHVGTWLFMIVSVFAAQPWCDHEDTFWYFLQVFS